MTQKHFTDELADAITKDSKLTETAKAQVLRNLHRLKETKVNILITGATGCGKSSTINAIFNADKAKVGQGVDPETMDIVKYEFNNIVLYDSPGLGDSPDADNRHSKNIIGKLNEKAPNGDMLIDLVLVILDGSTRDLGTSYELIEKVIIPNIGEDKKRLLVAINQADMAMKKKHWNQAQNFPEPELIKFLEDKVASTQKRIKEATGIDIEEPVYYVAGDKDGDKPQNPYNLSKLLLQILLHTKEEKRAVFTQDLNPDKKMWADDDELDKYREKIQSTLWESVKSTASDGADLGNDFFGGIGELVFSNAGEKIGGAVGKVVGGVIGGVAGAVSGIVRKIFSIFD
ncbi:MAG: 50S ribosome-binding GTPase [Methylococcales bacterium]